MPMKTSVKNAFYVSISFRRGFRWYYLTCMPRRIYMHNIITRYNNYLTYKIYHFIVIPRYGVVLSYGKPDPYPYTLVHDSVTFNKRIIALLSRGAAVGNDEYTIARLAASVTVSAAMGGWIILLL